METIFFLIMNNVINQSKKTRVSKLFQMTRHFRSKNFSFLYVFLILVMSSRVCFSQNTLLTLGELQQKKLYKTLEEALQEPDDVYRLNLQNTGITLLPPEISTLVNLQSLNISYNQISELPKELCELKNLQWLNLEATNIVTFPKEFIELKNLVYLNLNEMVSLNVNTALNKIFTFEKLKELSMNSVLMMSLPAQINKLKSLEKLKLQRCGLAEITREIGSLKNLKYLDLSFNEITKIPPEIGNLKKLEELYLGGNQLTELPEEIENLKENLLTLGLASAQSESGSFVGNPIPKEEANKIQDWLPTTKIIFVWN